jgi:outer membrane protein TolC
VALLPLAVGASGCAQLASTQWAPAPAVAPAASTADPDLRRAAFEDRAPATAPAPTTPLPLDACIRRALAANAGVRAARLNVEALRHRIPQVTALDDPVVSNTIYPIPEVAPQYSLMGYMPYSVLLAQQFPWFGTLRLRGQVAEQEVQIALHELAAAQLDAVEGVKRAYFDLQFNERAEALLIENRRLAEDFLQVARERYRTATAGQADVLRSEVAVGDIDRERESIRAAVGEARAELSRLLHLPPETEIQTAGAASTGSVPADWQRLTALAVAARPDLKGRLAAIARDQAAVELARKRYKPNVTVGLAYSQMEERGAMVGNTADGMPNVGLFLGFNLPIYRGKLAAGVCEAQARTAADAALYEAERDQAHRDIKGLYLQARSLQNVADLLRRVNLPAARQVRELTAGDYRAGAEGVDFLAVLGASRDLLEIELQVAQLEAELGKALASLERAVGVALNEHPPDPSALVAPAEGAPSPPPPAETGGPFEAKPGDEPPPANAPRPLLEVKPAR